MHVLCQCICYINAYFFLNINSSVLYQCMFLFYQSEGFPNGIFAPCACCSLGPARMDVLLARRRRRRRRRRRHSVFPGIHQDFKSRKKI